MPQPTNTLRTLAIAALLPLAVVAAMRGAEPRGAEVRGAEVRGAEVRGAEVRRIAAEPSVAVAEQWWPELTNAVTPIAWRDHPQRFCVIFDGTVLALPEPHKLLRHKWDQPLDGVQLSFVPSADGAIPAEPKEQYPLTLPGGRHVGDQRWLDGHAAPVLETRWRPTEGPMAGVTLRQRAFAHMAGGGEAMSGTEPMFAWIRLEIDRDASAKAQGRAAGFLVTIAAPHMRFEMQEGDNCRVMPASAAYPKPLRLEDGFVIEGDRMVRLAVATKHAGAGRVGAVELVRSDGGRMYLHVTLPPDAPGRVDLLLPMVPAERSAIKDELALGFDGAMAQADRFWSARPSTVATIHTPEPLVNAAIADGARLARMLTTTVPSTKQRSLLSGAMYYSYLWVTPTAMTKHMLLDPLGWHGEVDKYLEIYRQDQGRTKAPGPDFPPHPGYFGAPAALDSGNQWLSDHGSVLHAAARHALLTGDQEFIEKWLEPILKACDFIKSARQLPRAGPFAPPGVMPPAASTDISRPIQALTSDGMSYKGLVTAARLLRVIEHPRAAEFEKDAADYRIAIRMALAAKTERQPKWTDASGRSRPIIPMTLTTDDTDGLGHEHPFYLDAGPLFGVYSGAIAADDPLMRDAVAFFREGPHARGEAASDRSWNSPPKLIHEMSSAEPCYSWNVFHSHQLGDRQRYLEGMYSLFTGALSRQTHVSCETRGGITENVFASTVAVELARLAVVDDAIDPRSLHLLRLVPLAWVSEAEQTRFENMPTEFGPVTVKWKLADGGKTLNVEYAPRFRRRPAGGVLLHVPPAPGLTSVIVNGKSHPAEPGKAIKL